MPPKPDILIATNNQCNTLPNWWNILAKKYNVPLIVLNYPGEVENKLAAFEYVKRQHIDLIKTLEEISANKIDMAKLENLIANSIKSVKEWRKVLDYMPLKNIKPATFFDGINFLITSRCKSSTSELYSLMADSLKDAPEADTTKIKLFWLGYPLWYHPQRYLAELLGDFRITFANYLTWWNLDYRGENIFEQLFSAYNYTFLNLKQNTRNQKLSELIKKSGAECAVVLRNKSCKCDFTSAMNIKIPQAELEIDMIDRNFLDVNNAEKQIAILKDTL